MRAIAGSIPPDQAGQAALDGHSTLIVALRLIGTVGRVEPDHLAFAAIGLERRLLIVDQGDDDLAVPCRVDLADQGIVTVENSFLDHRIPGNLERIMLARTEQCSGYRKAFRALQCLDRRA